METRMQRRVRSELANAPINKLGDDVLIEILIRLPNPRYACRCKSVCKRWRSLISSPGFNREFASHYHNMMRMKKLPPPPLIPSDDPQKWRSSIIMSVLPAVPFGDQLHLNVLDCFKDLLLCGFVDRTTTHAEYVKTFLVCNPFTKQWLALPVAPDKPKYCSWTVSRLVCDPCISYDLDLGGGDDDDQNSFVVYSEYRFRVLTIYQDMTSVKLDMFSSDSGEWIREAIVLDGYRILQDKNVCSCNGLLFWSCLEDEEQDGYQRRRFGSNPLLASLNAFHLDIPIDIYACPLFEKPKEWDLAVSQGALHVILRETQTETVSVWRREEDGRSWTMQSDGSLKIAAASSSVSHYDLKCFSIVNIHPEKPEVVYFRYFPPHFPDGAFLSYDLRRGELEYFSEFKLFRPRWTEFQPRVSCWPTPIPRYLRWEHELLQSSKQHQFPPSYSSPKEVQKIKTKAELWGWFEKEDNKVRNITKMRYCYTG